MRGLKKPKLAIRPQHPCFVYEDADLCLTVYSKAKKSMRCFEVNACLDLAKASLIERMREK